MGENSNGQQKVDNKPQPRGRWARRIDSGEDLSQLEIAESRDGECTVLQIPLLIIIHCMSCLNHSPVSLAQSILR